MNPARVITVLLASAAAIASAAVNAQPRAEPKVDLQAIEPVTDPAQLAEWLQRLVGSYKYDGMIQAPDCPEPTTAEESGEGEEQSEPPNPCSTPQAMKGKSDCIAVGPGVQCIINVTWLDVYPPGGMHAVLASFLDPAMELIGMEPERLAIQRLIVNDKGIAEGGRGYIKGNTATFSSPCANADRVGCYHIIRIEAKPDAKLIWMRFSRKYEPEVDFSYAVMTLRRMEPEQGSIMPEADTGR